MTDEKAKFESPEADARRAETEIRKLAGVMGCRVVVAHDGEVLEVHVVSSEERHPKQIIRDIETVLLASFGVRIDHKKISVARYPAANSLVSGSRDKDRRERTNPRLRFLGLRINLTPHGGEIEVALGREKLQAFGSSSFTLASDPARAVVEATLEAVGRFLSDGNFQVGSVRRIEIGSHEGFLVQVDHVQAGRSVPLLGSALLSRDPNLSALHAALDAVNRYAGRLESTAGLDFEAGPEIAP
ncbi:MAG: hypothetical protein EHM19_03365 [Candidatus Latescibacterota bacterium]|nr:MAG: hypothetical protein EHM19_03365 [Candidatus Latescibacterota bacterium]